jgi:hypothetical protein
MSKQITMDDIIRCNPGMDTGLMEERVKLMRDNGVEEHVIKEVADRMAAERLDAIIRTMQLTVEKKGQ